MVNTTKVLKSLFAVVLLTLCMSAAGQAPAFEEMEFEPDSVKTTYKPAGKNYAFLRSKRGTGGLNKTAQADAILAMEVTEIVLVFTEQEAGAINEREEANRERWENLLQTYPELFQFSTTYKNVCQCNAMGDGEAFKKAQGFYVYVNGEVPKMEEPKAEEPKVVASTPPAVSTTRSEVTPPATQTKATENPPVTKTPKTEEKKVVTPAAKEVAVTDKTAVKTVEPPAPEKVAPEKPKEVETPAVTETPAETEVAEETARPAKTPAKRAPVAKARRSKDARACRQPCYGYGDDDLIAFFKDNIALTKKQKKKAKNWVANVRVQIHFDGTIKKVMVTGTNEDFNKMVEDAMKGMNPWNSAVKNGLAMKSEVKFNLKFDKETKAMKPTDFLINPRLPPKCKCATDSEIFGD